MSERTCRPAAAGALTPAVSNRRLRPDQTRAAGLRPARPPDFRLTVLALALAALACQTVLPPAAPAPRSTVTPPAASPTPDLVGLTRRQPFPAGAPAALPDWVIEVREFARGAAAWQALAEANMFNDPAPEGEEYVLVRVAARYTGSAPRAVAGTDFRITGDRGRAYFKASAVTPEPYLDAELRGGESAEGWTVYRVGQDESNLLLMFDPIDLDAGEAPPRYLALTPGARVEIAPELETLTPTALGADPREPAAFGQTLVTEDWELEALEFQRGARAWEALLAANQFNDPPPDGFEYVLVRVRVRALHTADEAVYLSGPAFFRSRTDDGETYPAPAVVSPEPRLEALLFPGGEITGWAALLAPVDTRLSLVFQPIIDFNDDQRRYIALQGAAAP